MSHRKYRETKQQPSRARSGHQISCFLVSLHFLRDILSCGPVHVFVPYVFLSNSVVILIECRVRVMLPAAAAAHGNAIGVNTVLTNKPLLDCSLSVCRVPADGTIRSTNPWKMDDSTDPPHPGLLQHTGCP